MCTSAVLLASLDRITHETTLMLLTLNHDAAQTSDRREAKRRVLELQDKAQELLDWLSEVRLEAPRN
jgi:hypothetical protein